ncbi:DUF2064 domain-containing protein [Metapseudomonas lalkuanensis]|uniref:DUF2064 domain-containing protein n=1 Tax=Metapseudomonas lalkuanensis TaxID=2604832 RepID=A0A5J6QL79_9GAMM|nr:TIGR04282 family arsenosugar biosynthesis glycosyltransferase [Pseudomonas lalkuanensis]QEY62031.1 DUF2064 domain-containing protein [Pseudomonas lalkuanensis]UCO99813.1 TIGR04282 family arsenosugar biosynthesis glycosyltransferase [Pseudomonas lalkuanensis]
MTLSISLHLLASAPQAGNFHPRLVPELGEEGVDRLHRQLVARVLNLPPLGFSERIFWIEDGPDEALEALAEDNDWMVVGQPVGDLGERMRRIAALGLSENDAVVLIGQYCPTLDADYLSAACEALDHHHAVLGPTEDGRYMLLGLRLVDPRLFEAIPWGSDQVLAMTCERLQELEWRHGLLPSLWVLDSPEHLPRLGRMGIKLGVA